MYESCVSLGVASSWAETHAACSHHSKRRLKWLKSCFTVSFSAHTPKNPLDFVSVAVVSIMAFCGRPKTALGEFAKCLQQEKAPDLSMKFPMYVVSLQNVLKMTEVRCHQQLLENGILTTKGDSGKAMFLSHQWVSQQHPDPDGKQLKVFQDAMKNLLDVSTVPNYSAWAEIMSVYLGRPRFATSDLSETSLFVWYDYFSIPQYTVTAQSRSVSTNLYEDQRNGILSISAYIHRCEFLVVLCPLMKHATLPADVNYHSWAERGWCRLEAMARELSVKNGSVLVIEGPKQVMLSSTWQSTFLAPGEGKFTVPDDREVVGKVLTDMLHKKLHDFLVKGDLCGYRLLLSRQHAWLRKCKVAPVPALLATSDAKTDLRDGGGVSSSVSCFKGCCEMRIAGVPTVLVTSVWLSTSNKKLQVWHVFHTFFWGFAVLRYGFSKVGVRQSWMVPTMLCSTGRTSGGVGSAIEQARKSQWESAKTLPWRNVDERSVCFGHLCSIWKQWGHANSLTGKCRSQPTRL